MLRLQETSGKAGTLRIQPGLLGFRTVTRADALERPLGSLAVRPDGVRVAVGRYEIVTLLLEP